jgi:Thioredoxin like C-terminal domain
VHFGEGDYSGTEQDIRTLLGVRTVAAAPPNMTPTEATTPETYLGPERLDPTRYAGSAIARGKSKLYTAATVVPQDAISYGGEWELAGQIATAGIGAQLLLHFQAKDVYIVLGGKGRVTARLGGKPLPTIDVDADRLYTVLSSRSARNGVLQLGFTPGVRAYSFTFG